jgi:scaffold protein (connect acetoacetyl-CoA thiolase and HMG-CoA synthase)
MTSFRPDVFEADPPALLGSSCTRCGGRAFPARDVCPACGAVDAAESVRLSREGVVYSFTVVRQAPPGLATPYVLAYVDLPADAVRVMARVEAEDVEIGLPVRLVARPDERNPGRLMFAFAEDPR